ncbi:MAG: hypothetical protein ACYCW6_20025 [Candidatus Xenobia bacterium]
MESEIRRFADLLVERGLGPAAIVALEGMKPLSVVGSQFLIFMDPIVRLFTTIPHYQEAIGILEDRERIEALICAVEEAEEAKCQR